MSWFQIGNGYYGLAVDSARLSRGGRKLAAKAFENAFSLRAKDIRLDYAPAKADRRSVEPRMPFAGKV